MTESRPAKALSSNNSDFALFTYQQASGIIIAGPYVSNGGRRIGESDVWLVSDRLAYLIIGNGRLGASAAAYPYGKYKKCLWESRYDGALETNFVLTSSESDPPVSFSRYLSV